MESYPKAIVACAGAAALAFTAATALNRRMPKSVAKDKQQSPQAKSNACPFGFASESKESGQESTSEFKTKLEDRKNQITTLYEEYIHLDMLRGVWQHPTTKNPQLEPVFTAAMHGLEISFLLLSEFVTDSRSYVTKRQRIESVAKAMAEQCTLIADLVDADLLMRELNMEIAHSAIGHDSDAPPINPQPVRSLSLAQEFPFPDCPPTVAGGDGGRQSPGLQRLKDAVSEVWERLRQSDRLALQNVIRNITSAFEGSFSRWKVGLSLEEQLNDVRLMVGLEPLAGLAKRRGSLHLDYQRMVRPEFVLATRTEERYTHSEDFFFRSVHLATECWSFVALDRLENAAEQCKGRRWHEAASYVRHAGLIIEYLGNNVSILKCMNLRDYLQLKVEIEGTSGEGSSQVKQLKPASQRLLQPLLQAVEEIAHKEGGSPLSPPSPPAGDTATSAERLVAIYKQPQEHAGLHDFAKALEFLDSSVCGGFYFRHFSLAVSVIGSDSRGTMNRSVKALKHAYETALFPSLDRARTLCGVEVDRELAGHKGRIMNDICERRRHRAAAGRERGSEGARGAAVARKSVGMAASSTPQCAIGTDERQAAKGGKDDEQGARGRAQDQNHPAHAAGQAAPPDPALEEAREDLYCEATLPAFFGAQERGPLSFLSHSFGRIPPAVHASSLKQLHQLYARPDTIWDVAFSSVIPEAQSNVLRLLSPHPANSGPTQHCVEFGHNTHELVSRLMSDAIGRDGALRVLCSDMEFYSFNRQMRRLLDFAGSTAPSSRAPDVSAERVPIDPVDTFKERFLARAKELKGRVNFVYVSHITYKTQQTLVSSLGEFGLAMNAALGCAEVYTEEPPAALPYVVVDGCHSFGALEVDISAAPPTLFYVSTLVKHAASGANAAFVCMHKQRASRLKPLSTGWLADPATLAPLSPGVSLDGASITYQEGCALAGATPGWLPSLITFNQLMRAWRSRGISLEHVHRHVVLLRKRLSVRLDEPMLSALLQPATDTRDDRSRTICMLSGTNECNDTHLLSHTLSLKACDAERAVWLVAQLKAAGIQVDSRGPYVRIGFGFNHSTADVDSLAEALKRIACTARGDAIPTKPVEKAAHWQAASTECQRSA